MEAPFNHLKFYPKVFFLGDKVKAKKKAPYGIAAFNALSNLMRYQNLKQHKLKKVYSDGTIVVAHKCFNEGTVTVFVPVIEKVELIEEEIIHVKRYITLEVEGAYYDNGYVELAGTDYHKIMIFNTATMASATDIPINGSTTVFASFPCDKSDVTDWLTDSPSISSALFVQTLCGQGHGNPPATWTPPPAPSMQYYWISPLGDYESNGGDYQCYDVNGNLVTNRGSLNSTGTEYSNLTPPIGCVDWDGDSGYDMNATVRYPNFKNEALAWMSDSKSLTYNNKSVSYYSAVINDIENYKYRKYDYTRELRRTWVDWWPYVGHCRVDSDDETQDYQYNENFYITFSNPLKIRRLTYLADRHYSSTKAYPEDWVLGDNGGDEKYLNGYRIGDGRPPSYYETTDFVGGVYDKEAGENVFCQLFFRRCTQHHHVNPYGGGMDPPYQVNRGDEHGDAVIMLDGSISFGVHDTYDARAMIKNSRFENAVQSLIDIAMEDIHWDSDPNNDVYAGFYVKGLSIRNPLDT